MRWLPLVTLVLLFPGCGESPSAPENQSSSLVVTAVSPSSGATVVVPFSYAYHLPGGVVLLPGSGLISVSLSTDSHTVTGFQVYRVPCDVTGIRAMLHTRNNGLLTPPLPSETIAETTASTSFRIVRCCS